MDRFRITGGRRLEGTVRISGAKNAALPAMAAALLTAEPVYLKNIPRVRDIITMSQLIAHTGRAWNAPDVPPTDLTIEAREHLRRGSALRTGAHDARLDSDAGPAGGAAGTRARIAAGRVRDWRASRGPAYQGAGADGRGDFDRAGLRDRARARRGRLHGARIHLRENHRHRHGEYSDGGGARRGRDAPREFGARAGSRPTSSSC